MRLLIALVILMLLNACGQKGPLFVPDDGDNQTNVAVGPHRSASRVEL